MANLFLEEPTYVTELELKDSTRLEDVEIIGDETESIENRKILLRKAEIVIDYIIGSFGTKLNPLQETIFPTIKEGIPKNIKKATVILVEQMFLGGELSESRVLSGSRYIKSEWYGDHRVEFQDQKVDVNVMSKKNQYINQEIEILIKPFMVTSSGSRWSKSV